MLNLRCALLGALLSSPAYSEGVNPSDLVSSFGLAIGVASGWSADEIAREIPDFSGVSVFEDRRLRGQVVEKAMADGQKFAEGGFPWISFTLTNVPLGEYSFRYGEYRVCLPWYSGSVPDDVQTDGIRIELNLGDEQAATHAENECSKWNLFGLTFFGAEYRIRMPDSALAEQFYNEVQSAGGGLSASIKCYFNFLEKTYPGANLMCNLATLEISIGGDGFDRSNVTYREYWDADSGEYKQDLLFGEGKAGTSEETCANCSAVNEGDGAANLSIDEQEIRDLNQVVGEYRVAGVSGTGSNYDAFVRIELSEDDDRLKIIWSLGSSTYSGDASLVNGVLAVDWSGAAAPDYLPSEYRLQKEGGLKGMWRVGSGYEVLVVDIVEKIEVPLFDRTNENILGAENSALESIVDLKGRYDVVGTGDGGEVLHRGSVLISANGTAPTASILWMSDERRVVGSARVVDGVLIVTWNGEAFSGTLPIIYKEKSGNLVGIWQDGSRSETLVLSDP